MSFGCLLFDVFYGRAETLGPFMLYFVFKHPTPGKNYSKIVI